MLCNQLNNAIWLLPNSFIDSLILLCKLRQSTLVRSQYVARTSSILPSAHCAGVYSEMGMLLVGPAGEISSIDSINASLVFWRHCDGIREDFLGHGNEWINFISGLSYCILTSTKSLVYCRKRENFWYIKMGHFIGIFLRKFFIWHIKVCILDMNNIFLKLWIRKVRANTQSFFKIYLLQPSEAER